MTRMRIATTGDLDGINHIRAALNCPALFESDIMPSSKRESFITIDSDDNDKIIAYLSMCSDTSFLSDYDATLDIFVLPDRQHHGTGAALMEYAFQYASNNTMLKRLTAGVSKDNPSATIAKRFLTKIGFYPIGTYGKAECFAKDIIYCES